MLALMERVSGQFKALADKGDTDKVTDQAAVDPLAWLADEKSAQAIWLQVEQVTTTTMVMAQGGTPRPADPVMALSSGGFEQAPQSGGRQEPLAWLQQAQQRLAQMGAQALQQVQQGQAAPSDKPAQPDIQTALLALPPRQVMSQSESGRQQDGWQVASSSRFSAAYITGSTSQSGQTPPAEPFGEWLSQRLAAVQPTSEATDESTSQGKASPSSGGQSASAAGAGDPTAIASRDTGAPLLQTPTFVKFMAAEQAKQHLSPAQQVSVQIVAARAEQQGQVTVKLHPAELGKVEVRLQVDHEQQTSVRVVTETREAYDLLRADKQALERILQESGMQMKQGGLEFGFQGDGSGASDQQGDGLASEPQADANASDAELTDEEHNTGDTIQDGVSLSVASGVNIRV
jgi:flagellar hook-length control protein FliK